MVACAEPCLLGENQGRGCELADSHSRRSRAGFAIFFLILLPLIAHGCHGDDVDHEPAVAPPQSEVRGEPGS
jgi:hypothetical protein